MDKADVRKRAYCQNCKCFQLDGFRPNEYGGHGVCITKGYVIPRILQTWGENRCLFVDEKGYYNPNPIVKEVV